MTLGLQILVKNLPILINKRMTNIFFPVKNNLSRNQILQTLLKFFNIKPLPFKHTNLIQKGFSVNQRKQRVVVQKVKKRLDMIGKSFGFLTKNKNLPSVLKGQKDKLIDLLMVLQIVLWKQKVQTLGESV